MVLLPKDLAQNEAANAGIYGDLMQGEVVNAALYRGFVQIESDNIGVYLHFLVRSAELKPPCINCARNLIPDLQGAHVQ